MKRLSKKLMSWASILEESTREQALRAASMPFIHPWIALMPDAHLGRGATVGSVIPTLGAIIPAAVGVDIGCFHGHTRVPLLNGTQRSLKELAEAGGSHWVYSLDDNGRIAPGLAVALRTRSNAELLRVTVSGGDEIICTPDHLFMMNDGTYRQARGLRFNDSLMPMYHRWQTRDGYESVSTGQGTSHPTHNLIYEALNGPVPKGFVVHHRNHVHFDNAPENLELLEAGAHSRHHRRAKPSFDNESPEFQDRRMAGIRQSNADPARQNQMAHTGRQNILRYMTERREHFLSSAALRWHKKREHGHNHKVTSVEPVADRADVYCLQVEKHHNFALAAGVFVHNCGMIAVRSQFTATDVRARGDLAALRESIEAAIPLSAGQYNAAVHDAGTERRIAGLEERKGADSAEMIAPNWRLQLGSLGSGNHFIEVSLDEEDRVWLFLHSGSRGVGNRLAGKHIKVARDLAQRWWIPLADPDLAYLVEGTGEFSAYLRDLHWAQHFALLNREEMMDRAVACLGTWIGEPVTAAETVNCHHNYTAREKHFGKDVWVSRKGAIDASAGTPGLIPGSMGTRSYVVTGKGSRVALNSSPHGAGREYSRNAARKRFSRAQLDAAMEGIEWRRTSAFLDEIPAAYKDIDVVMEDAKDLVEIRHTLRQIVNVKGD